MPDQTQKYGLPFPEPTDTPDVPRDIRRLAEALDVELGADAALIASKAPLLSPNFQGTPTAPTPSTGDSSKALATTAFTQSLFNTRLATTIPKIESGAGAIGTSGRFAREDHVHPEFFISSAGGGTGGVALPSGTAGQFLTSLGGAAIAWAPAPTGIPAGGTTGQILQRTASGVGWAPAPAPMLLPSPDYADKGKNEFTVTQVSTATDAARTPAGYAVTMSNPHPTANMLVRVEQQGWIRMTGTKASGKDVAFYGYPYATSGVAAVKSHHPIRKKRDDDNPGVVYEDFLGWTDFQLAPGAACTFQPRFWIIETGSGVTYMVRYLKVAAIALQFYTGNARTEALADAVEVDTA